MDSLLYLHAQIYIPFPKQIPSVWVLAVLMESPLVRGVCVDVSSGGFDGESSW